MDRRLTNWQHREFHETPVRADIYDTFAFFEKKTHRHHRTLTFVMCTILLTQSSWINAQRPPGFARVCTVHRSLTGSWRRARIDYNHPGPLPGPRRQEEEEKGLKNLGVSPSLFRVTNLTIFSTTWKSELFYQPLKNIFLRTLDCPTKYTFLSR